LSIEHHTRLTAPEIANLWTQYMNDSLAICKSKYYLEHIEDKDISALFRTASELATRHVTCVREFMTQEKFPIPLGFTDQDVNTAAPSLFQDALLLNYIYIMTLHGLTGYAVALSTSTRSDMQKYYIDCTKETTDFYYQIMKVLKSKGLYTRPPFIHPPEIAGYVDQQNFLAGWFGERRPLNCIEISNITFNMNKINLSKALGLGFSQVANSEEVRNYMSRGTQLSTKHTEVFNSIFREDNLNAPISWDSMVTNSTTSPFSDKLMMFHTQFLTQANIAFYGAGLATSMRKDLGVHYLRLIGEVLQYAEDGANIMINNGWMEKPPTAENRSALASGKKK
jgi:hypothetical protein